MTNEVNVVLCTCGKQLDLDYEKMVSEVEQSDVVSSVAIHDSLCQEDGLSTIDELLDTADKRLVIAACTNQKLKPHIDNYLRSEGKDPSLITYVNIREHSAWVHSDCDEATKKSIDMIRGGASLAALSTPLDNETKDVSTHITVIGGGIAGIESALSLANLGYDITIIEIEEKLGGHVRNLPVVAPTQKSGQEVIAGRLQDIKKHDQIEIMTNTRVLFFEGEIGNFEVSYTTDGEENSIKTSAIVLATGFREFKPSMMDEYRYGKNPDVITQYELSCMLSEGELQRLSDGGKVKEVVMVQCVGSRDENYRPDCSKLCCTFAIDNALQLLKASPDIKVHIVYMDIRVPFEHEMIYKESRENGVDYIRGRVSMVWEEEGTTHMRIYDSLLDKYFQLNPDLIVLSSAILPSEDLEKFSETLSYDVEDNGYIKELYDKLRKTETHRRGVVAVGGVTGPHFVFETITDAQAASKVIHNELRGGHIEKLSRGAVLDVDECIGCSLCAQECPRGVPLMIEQDPEEAEVDAEGEKILFKAAIDTLNCHACGVCQSLCPSEATQLNFLSNQQLWSQIEEILRDAGPDNELTLCFHCEECAVSTIDIVGTNRMEYSPQTRLVSVPCAGRISIIDLFKALEYGASTVMIAACETDRCHMGGTANEIAQLQVDVAKEILAAIGWHPERVEMFRMFSAEPNRFTEAVGEMVGRAVELGPTPVHKEEAGQWLEVSK
ncbi:MAG: hydrogenase iron-sulfur subunit [Candidatus Thorarchaeota archaeon]